MVIGSKKQQKRAVRAARKKANKKAVKEYLRPVQPGESYFSERPNAREPFRRTRLALQIVKRQGKRAGEAITRGRREARLAKQVGRQYKVKLPSALTHIIGSYLRAR